MKISKIALTRVVQNVIIPSVDMNIVRIRYAPQIAKKKTTTSSSVGSSTGSKATHSSAAIGSHSKITTGFQPAKAATSSCSGCSGRRSAAESSPSRIRHSQPYGVKTMFMFRTSVQTM